MKDNLARAHSVCNCFWIADIPLDLFEWSEGAIVSIEYNHLIAARHQFTANGGTEKTPPASYQRLRHSSLSADLVTVNTRSLELHFIALHLRVLIEQINY